MKNNFISILIKLACLLLISTSVSSDSDESAGDALDISLIAEYSSCADLYEINESEINNLTSILLLSGEAFFVEGDMVMSSTNAKAIVDSYDPISNKLTYYQTAKTGFKSFSLNEKLVGRGAGVSTIEEFVLDFGVPCSDLIVSIEESPEQMMFVFADSEEAIRAKLASQEMMAEIEAEMARQAALDAFQAKLAADKAAAAASTAAYQAKLARDERLKDKRAELKLEKELAAFEAQLEAELAAQEMMAEIETEMARQAALDAFQAKLAADKAAAAKSTAAYQSKLANDAKVAALMAELSLEKELAAFEAQLAAELASQEMMAEIQAEMARQSALDAFQAKLAADKAAAAKSTAAYQSKVANDARIAALMDQLNTEKELAAFEAQLEAELAAQQIIGEEFDRLAQIAEDAFEAQLEAELAAQEMMAEIEVEMARQAALDAFQANLAADKAAAAASTAAYQAKNAYDVRVTKIMDDLIIQLDELGIADSYKSVIADELINEATEKLEDEKFIGAISGEIVTVAIHDFCKVNLGLSDSNIELFRKALAGNYLGNVGPQVTHGTEFTSGRWDEYIECVGSKRK